MARSTLSLAVAAVAGAAASQHLPDNAEELLNRTRQAVAQVDLAHLTRGITLDAIHGDAPPEPDEFDGYARRMLLAPDGRDSSRDPWGGSYEVQNRDGFSIVRSNGPDGRPGTDDDLVRITPTFAVRMLLFR